MAKQKQGRRGFMKGAGLVAGGVLSSSILPSSAQSGQTAPGTGSKGAQFRSLLAKSEVVVAPIVPDIVAARLCELEGFPAVQIGDSQPTTWHGFPGLGLVSYTEVLNFSVHIAGNTNLLVMVGMADGGGNPLTIYRATQELERGGVAAVAYEDTTDESHFVRRGTLVSTEVFVDRIKAAVDARKDQSLVIIARTDALEKGYTIEQALERGVACAEAGADVIYFSGMRLEDHSKARDLVKKPLFHLGNARTTPDQARAAKVSVVAYHVDGVAHGALYQALKELKTTGTFENSLAKLQLPNDVRAKLIQSDEYNARARKYHLIK
ncbi:MAG TPA: isocitrate lyase/phosphoenolpyruvate mutase family protein [Terriglobia bacterium]|nr:isocitrate lyase/phosphoenolpyruvate mutase family protein [Terriglobia bacterium]